MTSLLLPRDLTGAGFGALFGAHRGRQLPVSNLDAAVVYDDDPEHSSEADRLRRERLARPAHDGRNLPAALDALNAGGARAARDGWDRYGWTAGYLLRCTVEGAFRLHLDEQVDWPELHAITGFDQYATKTARTRTRTATATCMFKRIKAQARAACETGDLTLDLLTQWAEQTREDALTETVGMVCSRRRENLAMFADVSDAKKLTVGVCQNAVRAALHAPTADRADAFKTALQP